MSDVQRLLLFMSASLPILPYCLLYLLTRKAQPLAFDNEIITHFKRMPVDKPHLIGSQWDSIACPGGRATTHTTIIGLTAGMVGFCKLAEFAFLFALR